YSDPSDFRFRRFRMLNEFDTQGPKDPAQGAELMMNVYPAFRDIYKAAIPDSTMVISLGDCPYNCTDYLRNLLVEIIQHPQYEGVLPFDGIDFHVYSPDSESVRVSYNMMRQTFWEVLGNLDEWNRMKFWMAEGFSHPKGSSPSHIGLGYYSPVSDPARIRYIIHSASKGMSLPGFSMAKISRRKESGWSLSASDGVFNLHGNIYDGVGLFDLGYQCLESNFDQKIHFFTRHVHELMFMPVESSDIERFNLTRMVSQFEKIILWDKNSYDTVSAVEIALPGTWQSAFVIDLVTGDTIHHTQSEVLERNWIIAVDISDNPILITPHYDPDPDGEYAYDLPAIRSGIGGDQPITGSQWTSTLYLTNDQDRNVDFSIHVFLEGVNAPELIPGTLIPRSSAAIHFSELFPDQNGWCRIESSEPLSGFLEYSVKLNSTTTTSAMKLSEVSIFKDIEQMYLTGDWEVDATSEYPVKNQVIIANTSSEALDVEFRLFGSDGGLDQLENVSMDENQRICRDFTAPENSLKYGKLEIVTAGSSAGQITRFEESGALKLSDELLSTDLEIHSEYAQSMDSLVTSSRIIVTNPWEEAIEVTLLRTNVDGSLDVENLTISGNETLEVNYESDDENIVVSSEDVGVFSRTEVVIDGKTVIKDTIPDLGSRYVLPHYRVSRSQINPCDTWIVIENKSTRTEYIVPEIYAMDGSSVSGDVSVTQVFPGENLQISVMDLMDENVQSAAGLLVLNCIDKSGLNVYAMIEKTYDDGSNPSQTVYFMD
nr:hypothetical protein [bacterium]